MEPMRPERREELIRKGAVPADIDEYEGLLVERMSEEPIDDDHLSDRASARERRIQELWVRINRTP